MGGIKVTMFISDEAIRNGGATREEFLKEFAPTNPDVLEMNAEGITVEAEEVD